MASAGTAYVDIEAKLDSLASDVDAAISAIDTQTIDIDAVADTSTAQADIDSVEGGSTEIAVEANTEQAQANIDELADSTSQLGDVAQGALGGIGNLGGAAAGATSSLGSAAVAGAGAAAGIFEFAQAAIDAESATQRFNLIAGDLADQVGAIDVGGLSGDIGDLALQLGSSDEAMLNATASFVAFAESTGASDEQIVTASDNINALALRAVALNPALGDAGAVAERMTNALARGGRATTQFGIGLTSAEINARALSDTGKDNVADLTQFEKAAAGAEIAVERLGNTMGTDFQVGSQNARTEWNRMTESLGEAAETVGGTMLPAIENITEAVTELGDGLANLSPKDWLSGLWDLSGGLIANGVTDLWDAISGGDEQIRGTGEILGELPPALRDTADAGEGAAASIDDLSNALTGYLDGAFALPEAQRNLRDSFKDLFDTLLTEGHSADDVAGALEDIAYRTADVGAASGNFAVSADLTITRLRQMRDAGQISADQFNRVRDAIRGAQDEAPLTVPTSAPGATAATQEIKGVGEAAGKVPPMTYAGVQARGAAQAFADVDRVKRQLEAIDGKTYTSYVGVVTTGSAQVREHGGPVEAGMPYIVGEKRPELFVPTRNGTILPSVPSSMNGATYNVTVNAPTGNGDDIARAVTDAIRQLERAGR